MGHSVCEKEEEEKKKDCILTLFNKPNKSVLKLVCVYLQQI